MREPTEVEIENLFHAAIGYDPVKAHEYYLRTRKLKGRQRAAPKITEDDPRWNPKTMGNRRGSLQDPRTGKTREQIAKDARTRQRKELSDRIDALSDRLNKLEALIKKRETEEKSENRKSKAKKERAAKEKDKPKTAAEKAEAARESEKYRDKHKQELKNKSGDKKSGGSSSGSKQKAGGKHSVSELRSLATKVRGQIAVAKQKLAAL
jgi:hypothetical protein